MGWIPVLLQRIYRSMLS